MYALVTELKSHFRPRVSVASVVERDVPVLPTEMHKRTLTLLCTEIVEATKMVERLGDEAWHQLQMQHNGIVRARLAAFHGREVKCTDDGSFTVFHAPAQGLRCAAGIRASLQALGMRVRCGLHTAECLVDGSRVSGLAVHTAARIAGAARPNEILASRAVKDLVAGGDIKFAEGHFMRLRGLSDEHELFTVNV
jgi:class 3 adenylate cyclase